MSARKTAAGILIAAVVGVALYDYGFTTVWDGVFSLTVDLRAAEPDRIGRVWAAAAYHREYAEEILDDSKSADERFTEIADWQKPFVVEVPCSWGESGFGREKWRGQYHALIIRIEYRDGRREHKIVDMPDYKQTRELTVEVP
jgi:hypothetical protein